MYTFSECEVLFVNFYASYKLRHEGIEILDLTDGLLQLCTSAASLNAS